MKTKILTLLFAVLVPYSLVQAEGDATGVHPIKQDTHADKRSGFTLYLEGGASLFDGDLTPASGNNIIPRTSIKPQVGFGVEYAITPVWNIGFDYNWFQYGGESKDGTAWLRGNAHALGFYVSADMMDWFAPRRKREMFSILPAIGAAVETYDAKSQRTLTQEERKYNETILDKTQTIDGKGYQGFKDNFVPTIPVSLTLAFNINRSLALAIKGEYRIHLGRKGDALDNWEKGNSNDGQESLQLQLRWKLNPKNRDHKFNMLPENSESAMKIAKQALAEAKKANARLDSIEPILDQMGGKLDSVYNYVMGPDSDKDGVPDSHDLEPNTDKDATFVDYWGRGHKVDTDNGDEKTTKEIAMFMPPTIYFANDSYAITSSSDYEIRKVATQMLKDNSLHVEIRAYCDYTASDEYNMQLAIRRADATKRKLVSYGIKVDRIITNPFGRLKTPAAPCAANRRVEMLFDK